MSRDEIIAWYEAEIGQAPDAQTIEKLIHESSGGRPAYLEMLLSALQKNSSTPPIPNFDGLQRVRRRSLSANARRLGDLMSLLPGEVAIPRSLLDAAGKASGIEVRAALDELDGAGVIRRVGERVRFVHSSYATSWVGDIDNDECETLKEFWYAGLAQVGFGDPEHGAGGLLSLVAPRIIERQSIEDVTRLAVNLQERGAQDDSLLLLTTSWQAVQEPDNMRDGVIQHALQAARLQLDLGRYAAVQEPLRVVELQEPDGTPLRNAADLLRMKLALRLNRYPLVWALSDKLDTSKNRLFSLR